MNLSTQLQLFAKIEPVEFAGKSTTNSTQNFLIVFGKFTIPVDSCSDMTKISELPGARKCIPKHPHDVSDLWSNKKIQLSATHLYLFLKKIKYT